VTAICPGNRGISDEQVRQTCIDQVPMKRGCTWTLTCNVVAFLASDQASTMTGQAINVTGGQDCLDSLSPASSLSAHIVMAWVLPRGLRIERRFWILARHKTGCTSMITGWIAAMLFLAAIPELTLCKPTLMLAVLMPNDGDRKYEVIAPSLPHILL
jgi:hypothetical protein